MANMFDWNQYKLRFRNIEPKVIAYAGYESRYITIAYLWTTHLCNITPAFYSAEYALKHLVCVGIESRCTKIYRALSHHLYTSEIHEDVDSLEDILRRNSN